MPHRERLPVDPHRRQLAGARAEVRRQKALHLRRRLRLAEAVAPVSFEVLSPSPVEVEPLLDEAYRVEAAGWKGEFGTAQQPCSRSTSRRKTPCHGFHDSKR